jgi:hypothetical protein
MTSVVRQTGDSETAIELGGYLLRVQYQEGTHATGPLQQECPNVPPGAAIIINNAQDEFVIAGEGLSVTFLPDSEGPEHVELMSVEEGTFFPCAAPSIQKVRLFRHN